MPSFSVFFFWDTYGLNVVVFNIIPEVSEVVLIYFLFFPLYFVYFHYFVFYLNSLAVSYKNSAIPFLGIYPSELKTYIHTKMFIQIYS